MTTYKISPLNDEYYLGEINKGQVEVYSTKYKTLVAARKRAYAFAKGYEGRHYVFRSAGYTDESGRFIRTHYYPMGYVIRRKDQKYYWLTYDTKKGIESKDAWIIYSNGTLGGKL